MKKETHTSTAYDGFLNDLISSNVTLLLKQDPYADSNENYELLHNHVTSLKNNIYLPNMLNSINIETKGANGLHKVSCDRLYIKIDLIEI